MIKFDKLSLYSSLFVFVVSFYFLYFYCGDVLPFHEHISTFVFRADWAKQFLLTPDGVLELLTLFIVQFVYYKVFGIALYALVLSACNYCFAKVLKIESRIISLIVLLPVSFFLFAISRYNLGLSVPLALLLISAVYLRGERIRGEKQRWLYMVISLILLYFITGGFAIIFAALVLINESFFVKQKSKEVIISITLLVFLLPLVASVLYYRFSLREAVEPHIINVFRQLMPDYKSVFYIVVVAGFLPISLLIKAYFKKSRYLSNFSQQVILLICLIAGVYWGFKNLTVSKNMVHLSDLAICADSEDWDKLLKMCDVENLSLFDIHFTNIALSHQGRLTDEMFHYYQVGSQSLLLIDNSPMIVYLSNHFYDVLGMNNLCYITNINATMHYSNSPFIYKRLAYSSLIQGDYVTAQKHLNYLGNTLFYRHWAREHMLYVKNPELIKENEEMMRRRALLLKDNDFLFSSSYGAGALLSSVINAGRKDKPLVDYAVAYALLSKDLKQFSTILSQTRSYTPQSLPIHIQEALLLLETPNRRIPYISDGIRKSYANFLAADKKNTNMTTMYQRYGKTYWYYYTYEQQ